MVSLMADHVFEFSLQKYPIVSTHMAGKCPVVLLTFSSGFMLTKVQMLWSLVQTVLYSGL